MFSGVSFVYDKSDIINRKRTESGFIINPDISRYLLTCNDFEGTWPRGNRKRSFRPWNQRGRFHSPRPILAIEGAFPIPSQGPEPDILFRLVVLLVPVVAPPPLGGSEMDPSRGPVDGAGVSRRFDRPGDPGALPLPGRGDAGAVHGPRSGDHPRGVPARPAQRRARPALRGGGGAPAGGPDLHNLSLTRTATVTLGRGAEGVIGIGRVKTPTLAIACRREIEIRDFVPVGYLEAVATAHPEGGAFRMRHAPKERILEREAAQAVLAGAGIRGPARGAGRGQEAAPAPAARPALAPEAVQRTLRLVGIEDAGSGPGAL